MYKQFAFVCSFNALPRGGPHKRLTLNELTCFERSLAKVLKALEAYFFIKR